MSAACCHCDVVVVVGDVVAFLLGANHVSLKTTA